MNVLDFPNDYYRIIFMILKDFLCYNYVYIETMTAFIKNKYLIESFN